MEGSNSNTNTNTNSNSEDFAVGCLLSIKTTLGDEFEGQVITFDRPSNILVLHILLFLSLSFFSFTSSYTLLFWVLYISSSPS
ncbi:hypothetical protein Tsubulata_030934 [Turnera subulata]|uniref:LSM12 LSM domain-containing protein n=1 Tax=Turnera subulata TaxID=218843 RepID=A0A9Q0GCZ0_9ROSI|nr:hypothetical protein Tsubulata_030934 [Turnera subulata]